MGINDMERRLGIMQSVEPVLENAIKTLQKVVDVRGMGKKLIQIMAEEENSESVHIEDITQDAVDGAKAKAVAKSVKDGETAMKKAAASMEKAASRALGDAGPGESGKATKRAALKASRKKKEELAKACKTCEKEPLTKAEKADEEQDKKIEKEDEEAAKKAEKAAEDEEKKNAADDEPEEEEEEEEKKEEKKEVKLDKNGKPICTPKKEENVQLADEEESDSDDE